MLNLALPIAAPPWTKLGKKLESMCRKAIFTFGLLDGVDHVAVALSGGKDSLTLLFLLKAIIGRGTERVTLSAIHLSGAFSCGASVQTNFLRSICQKLEVPFYEVEGGDKEPEECYSCSRLRRTKIFSKAREIGARTVAFGHHRDDNIQTLLMNLCHKAEFAANLPKLEMVDYGVTIIRPLIYIAEDAIKEFARSHGFARVTCNCPIGARSMRSQTKELLEQMEELFPNIRENLSFAALKYGSKKAIKEVIKGRDG